MFSSYREASPITILEFLGKKRHLKHQHEYTKDMRIFSSLFKMICLSSYSILSWIQCLIIVMSDWDLENILFLEALKFWTKHMWTSSAWGIDLWTHLQIYFMYIFTLGRSYRLSIITSYYKELWFFLWATKISWSKNGHRSKDPKLMTKIP